MSAYTRRANFYLVPDLKRLLCQRINSEFEPRFIKNVAIYQHSEKDSPTLLVTLHLLFSIRHVLVLAPWRS